MVASCSAGGPGSPAGSPGGEPADSAPAPWFGGYVDLTAYPYHRFAAETAGLRATTVLAFVVAHPEDPCLPSWGGYYGLDEAGTVLGLDAQIAELRAGGGDVAVSFGGAAGNELAAACADPEKTLAAYRSVVARYGLGTIDLDIEMDDLGNEAANLRRAGIVARLQDERAEGDALRVWLTLPAEPDGLDPDGRAVVSQMLAAGIDLAGVNLMVMDYGESRPRGMDMLEASTAAARAAQVQLKGLYGQAGLPLAEDEAWRKIGLTPMIGQNDVRAEVFGTDAAAGLNGFARAQGVGRMSLWSLNRDAPCGPEWKDPRKVSNTCSGVAQDPGEFSRILGAGFGG